jgi:hypothetical protein
MRKKPKISKDITIIKSVSGSGNAVFDFRWEASLGFGLVQDETREASKSVSLY